ncbi:MAG TPA: DUF5989 family protein [Candidatus Brocadiia bacterium]|nr:DUF5989 family protein [Candidatus Brocadiia bacterium]
MPKPSLTRDFWDFLKENKKWWLIPIVVVLLFMALLIILGSGAGPTYIYPIF